MRSVVRVPPRRTLRMFVCARNPCELVAVSSVALGEAVYYATIYNVHPGLGVILCMERLATFKGWSGSKVDDGGEGPKPRIP